MFIIVILIYAVIGFLEIFPLVKEKRKKELLIYSGFFFIAFVMSLLLSLGVKLPSPADPIEAVVKAVIGK